MGLYPIFLELEGKTVLVVGGGRVAQRKVLTLMEYGARICIISDKLTDKLKSLVDDGEILNLGGEFRENHLKGAFLVVAATNDKRLNHRIGEIAKKKEILVNAVDQPPDCNFFVPSIIKRGDLQIAISTSGKSPALAKKIRQGLEEQFGEEYASFLVLMGYLRREVLSMGFSQDKNNRIFHEMVDSGILKAIAQDNREKTKSILSRILPKDLTEKISDFYESLSV